MAWAMSSTMLRGSLFFMRTNALATAALSGTGLSWIGRTD